MTRLLLTGAGGFAGRHLLAHLAGQGYEMSAPPFDITEAAAVARAVAQARPQALLHLAGVAAIGAAAADPARAWAVNLHGTLNLAQAVLDHAPDCRFIFISSCDIYGRAFLRAEPVDEDTAPAPANLYAATKAAAELALGAMPGLRLLRLRPANHAGAGQSPDFVLPAFARQIARIEAGLQAPVLRVGNLQAERDFLDVGDVCAAYAAALRLDFAPGEILNIASGQAWRIGDLLEQLLAQARTRISVETDPARLRPAEIPVARISAARARARLGWAPQIPMAELLGHVLEDWRARVAAGED